LSSENLIFSKRSIPASRNQNRNPTTAETRPFSSFSHLAGSETEAEIASVF
jgi:hypothetical protein